MNVMAFAGGYVRWRTEHGTENDVNGKAGGSLQRLTFEAQP